MDQINFIRATIAVVIALSVLGCKSPAEEVGGGDVPSREVSDESGWIELESALGTYVVMYRTEPAPIPLNELFAIDVRVLDAATQKPMDVDLAVDARMPQHRHGMNTAPVVMARGSGAFHIEGMLFHMPGRWELYFDVMREGITERAEEVINLE